MSKLKISWAPYHVHGLSDVRGCSANRSIRTSSLIQKDLLSLNYQCTHSKLKSLVVWGETLKSNRLSPRLGLYRTHKIWQHTDWNSKLKSTRCNVSWFIYFYRHSACFRRFLLPSPGVHNCTYSFRYCQPTLLLAAIVDEMEIRSISFMIATNSGVGWQYLKLYVQLCAPDDGRMNSLKHVAHL